MSCLCIRCRPTVDICVYCLNSGAAETEDGRAVPCPCGAAIVPHEDPPKPEEYTLSTLDRFRAAGCSYHLARNRTRWELRVEYPSPMAALTYRRTHLVDLVRDAMADLATYTEAKAALAARTERQ